MSQNFDDFWRLYPRKVAKGKARSAWDKQIKAGFSPDLIMDGLQRLHGHLMATEPQFRPHPASWLNDERWTDEPAPPRQLTPSMGTGPFGRRTAGDAMRDFLRRIDDQPDDDMKLIN
jgi:hypothetical protein